jgi:hypothetical protein
METHASLEFAYDWQKDLYIACKQLAMLVDYPFIADAEATYIGILTTEEATDLLVETSEKRKAFEKRTAKKKGKEKTAGGTADPPETTTPQTLLGSNETEDTKLDLGQFGENEASSSKPTGAKSTKETSDADPSDPSNSSSSDDDGNDGDAKRRISREDKERVRGRTLRIERGGGKQQRSCLRWTHQRSILARMRANVPMKRYNYSLVNCQDIFDWRYTSIWKGTLRNTFSGSSMDLPIVGLRLWTREIPRFVGRSLRLSSTGSSSPRNMLKSQ